MYKYDAEKLAALVSEMSEETKENLNMGEYCFLNLVESDPKVVAVYFRDQISVRMHKDKVEAFLIANFLVHFIGDFNAAEYKLRARLQKWNIRAELTEFIEKFYVWILPKPDYPNLDDVQLFKIVQEICNERSIMVQHRMEKRENVRLLSYIYAALVNEVIS